MIKLILKLALVALVSCCTSGCALFGAEARGNATYDYKVQTDAQGKITACEVKIVSGREVQGSANIKACAPGGQIDVTASGALNQGADRSTDPVALLRAGQQLMLGQPITVPAPVVVTPTQPPTTPTPH